MAVMKNTLIFLIFFITFLGLGFYGYHLYKYPSDADLSKKITHLRKHYPDEFLMKIGCRLKKPESRANHFLKFSQKKEKGTIRTGTFGDSFTFGSEVNKEASYPVQLQMLLNRNFPLQKIEVLNFGMNGQGFQEQFFLWERYAKLYGLDYILYGPRGFYPDRDLTFQRNWTYKHEDFCFPRDRFVLSEENKIRLISLKGSSPEKKYKIYYTLFPSFTALRYDRQPFQLWESYFPFFKGKLTNPFYYSNLTEHVEFQKISQILLNKIKSVYNKNFFLFDYKNNFFKSHQGVKFLYRVFGHSSALGNEITAHIYFNALIGKKNFISNVIDCYFSQETKEFVTKKKILFNKIKNIFIGTKNISLGEIRLNSSEHHWRKRGAFSQDNQKNIKSFIGFADFSKNNLGLSPYFPIPFELNDKSTIFIQSSKKETISLGEIKTLDSFWSFFNLYSNYTKIKPDKNYNYYEVHFFKEKLPSNLKKNLLQNPHKKLYLLVDDYVLGELLPSTYYEGEPSFVLKPRSKNSFLMMGPQHLVQERQLPSQFPLYMHYRMKDGRTLKSLIPEWSCRKEKHTYQLDLPNFEPLKK